MAFHGSVQVRVHKNVSLDSLTKLIDAIGRSAGCSPCGLLGVEVRFIGDPSPDAPKLPSFEGVGPVTVGP
jgi:hypothetical protein